MMASMPVALIPFLQNRCVAAPSRRPRADSSSPVARVAAADFFFEEDCHARSKSTARFIKSHLHALKIIALRRQLHGV